tara:strand:- start:1910 stop:2401 length:492 start_codon:yes stop_codon:yes gene_type:complete
MPIIESISGKKQNIKCISCALANKETNTEGGLIYKSKYFEVRQDFEIPIPAFFVISSKRHIIGFADFNEKEKKEFIDLLCNLRKGMRDILKIKYSQLLFREEVIESKINPSHFHVAILPKYSWMNKHNTSLKSMEFARKNMKTKANLKKIEQANTKIKRYLAK